MNQMPWAEPAAGAAARRGLAPVGGKPQDPETVPSAPPCIRGLVRDGVVRSQCLRSSAPTVACAAAVRLSAMRGDEEFSRLLLFAAVCGLHLGVIAPEAPAEHAADTAVRLFGCELGRETNVLPALVAFAQERAAAPWEPHR